jgi:hypothetical protein
MFLIEFSYLGFVSIALVATYIFLKSFLPYFLNLKPNPTIQYNDYKTYAIIAGTSVAIMVISYLIPNIELGNRFIHAAGGGFMGVLVCFLAVKHSGIGIDRPRFAILSLLLVTTLGVFNEIAEFYLQYYVGFVSAPHIYDTWLDLISNMFGFMVAISLFTPFHDNKTKRLSL